MSKICRNWVCRLADKKILFFSSKIHPKTSVFFPFSVHFFVLWDHHIIKGSSSHNVFAIFFLLLHLWAKHLPPPHTQRLTNIFMPLIHDWMTFGNSELHTPLKEKWHHSRRNFYYEAQKIFDVMKPKHTCLGYPQEVLKLIWDGYRTYGLANFLW